MAKFNTHVRAAVSSPITTGPAPTVRTHEGGPGYARDAKSELFLMAVGGFFGEDTFYEQARDRDNRFVRLVRQCALADPDWTVGLLGWLRSEANIRSAAIVGAAEFVHARLEQARARVPVADGGMAVGMPLPHRQGVREVNRVVVDAVCQRADEPGELLAYWMSKYGRTVPKPVKRGLGDAVRRLYSEYTLTKYDSAARDVRFADVLALTHPAPAAGQGELFVHAIERRHGRDEEIPERLAMLRARAQLLALPTDERRGVLTAADGPARLKAAGMTWEAIAGWLQGPMDAAAWEAIIPSMGVFALARNLRNFDEAGVSDEVAQQVAARLAHPAQVAKSRMLPFRWWQAHRAAPSLRWGQALEKALAASTGNIPALSGRTLVLVDTSGSMERTLSGRSEMMMVEAAALFGIALTARSGDGVDLYGFADGTFKHKVTRGGAVLREMERFVDRIGEAGHGTAIADAVRRTYDGHERVVILSDMQTFSGNPWVGNVSDQVPQHIPVYAFNLAGYEAGAIPSGLGTRHELGGLSDHTFGLIPMLEAGRSATWPWAGSSAA